MGHLCNVAVFGNDHLWEPCLGPVKKVTHTHCEHVQVMGKAVV